MPLNIVEKKYLKLLRPQLEDAIRIGEPDRAATCAKALAKLHKNSDLRKEKDNGHRTGKT